MERETQINGPESTVEGINQRTGITDSGQNWRYVQSIIPRHGKRIRMEGKTVHTFLNFKIINAVGFGDKFILQTSGGVYMVDI
jgi:hypothetical protein